MKDKHRDPTPEESRLYRCPSVFTDPKVPMLFTDPGSDTRFLKKAFIERTPGFVRSWKLIEKGMLLQVECMRFVLWDYLVEQGSDMSYLMESSEEDAAEYRTPVPDLVYDYSLHSLPDFTTQEELTDYIHGFTERSIDLLKMDQKTAEFVRDNQEGVINYLAKKLKAGNLRLYRAGACCPEFHEPIAIGDLTDPQKPKLLYLVYGLRPLIWEPPEGPHAYIPWKPCLESSEELVSDIPISGIIRGTGLWTAS